jgi:hypothetical protein
VVRTQSQRDLIATFVALCESEGTEYQELDEFLVAHSTQLRHLLRAPAADLHALVTLAPESRATGVRRLTRQAKEREQTAQANAAQNLSLAAATMLALSAVWEGEHVTLDARIALGRNLLADRTRRFIRFDVEGRPPLVIRREKLSEAGKVLKFADVSCALDRRGLRFRWRAGKGGLLLVDQKVDARYRDAVLSVVIARPRSVSVAKRPALAHESRSGWLGDFLGELTSF